MAEQLLYEDFTGRIIGCAMKMHSALGTGFRESVYQQSLAIEMSFQNLSFIKKKLCRSITGK